MPPFIHGRGEQTCPTPLARRRAWYDTCSSLDRARRRTNGMPAVSGYFEALFPATIPAVQFHIRDISKIKPPRSKSNKVST
jgi:hypothetical protein